MVSLRTVFKLLVIASIVLYLHHLKWNWSESQNQFGSIWNPFLDTDLNDHLISDCADFKDHSFVLELLHECFNVDILATDFGFGGSSIYSKLPHITKDGLFSRIIPNEDLAHIIWIIWYDSYGSYYITYLIYNIIWLLLYGEFFSNLNHKSSMNISIPVFLQIILPGVLFVLLRWKMVNHLNLILKSVMPKINTLSEQPHFTTMMNFFFDAINAIISSLITIRYFKNISGKLVSMLSKLLMNPLSLKLICDKISVLKFLPLSNVL